MNKFDIAKINAAIAVLQSAEQNCDNAAAGLAPHQHSKSTDSRLVLEYLGGETVTACVRVD